MYSANVRRCGTFAVKAVNSLLRTTEPVHDVRVQGWSQKVHRVSKCLFLHVGDGLSSETIQVVVPREVCDTVSPGSAVDVCGDWTPSQGRLQQMELLATACRVVGPSSSHTLEEDAAFLRQLPHLRAKSPAFSALLQLRSAVNAATHNFFQVSRGRGKKGREGGRRRGEKSAQIFWFCRNGVTTHDQREGFVHIDTPVLSLNDCEGAGEAFLVNAQQDSDFFGHPAIFLPVSSQLHLEAIASGIPRVYTVGAAFRAEKSLSRSHLAEFRMLEAEYAFAESVDELCALVERYLTFVVRAITEQEHFASTFDLVSSIFGNKESEETPLVRCGERRFPRLRYNDAVKILQRKGDAVAESGFNKQQELDLVRHCESPVFVVDYPSTQKPFYMKRVADGQHAECFDLLAPFVGELAGGSLRETDASALRERGCGRSLDWYVQLRDCGHPPTAGFGIGVERLVQSLFGIPNIKDTTAFPRWFKHCRC